MSARELALELSQLPSTERERLLAELPAAPRAEIARMLQEINSLVKPVERHFEAHLTEQTQAMRAPFASLNDGQLRLLLVADHPSVQRHVMGLARNGQLAELAPAVRTVLTEYLTQRLRANQMHVRPDDRISLRPWFGWKWPWRGAR